MSHNIVFLVFLYLRCCNCANITDTLAIDGNITEMYLKQSTTTEYPIVTNVDEQKSEIFARILGEKYDKTERPSAVEGKGPTLVYVAINIRSLENIDDTKNEYSIKMYFRQKWVDPRLRFADIAKDIDYFYLQDDNRVWMPDLYFLNEKKGKLHDILSPNRYTRIYRDGLVEHSCRITILASCIFNLRSFPLDVQSCPISIGTYGWTTKDLIIQWAQKNEPVIHARDFDIARFKLRNFSTENLIKTYPSGEYSVIRLNISFERELGFYLIQIYIPCGMLVIVSWVSFWLEPDAVEARVSIGVTTILTIVTQTYGINQNAPPASYVKALDVWTAFCQVMVFGVLLQFSMVNFLFRSKISEEKRNAVVGKEFTLTEQESLPLSPNGGENSADIFPIPKVLESEILEKNISKAKGRPRISVWGEHDLLKWRQKGDTTAKNTEKRFFCSFWPPITPFFGNLERTHAPFAPIFSTPLAKRIDIASRVIFPCIFVAFNITYWLTYT